VAVEGKTIRLYVIDTDQEVVFDDAHELAAWMRAYKAHALENVPERAEGKKSIKRFFEWE